MSNSLGFYDPLFYAQEALISLNRALGLAGRVHRGYDKAPQQKGSTINISRPTQFTATDVNTATGGTTTALAPDEVSITLNEWQEVKFALTDKELSFTQEKIIEDHIAPAAYALADAIDQSLAALIIKFPWYSNFTSTIVVSDILNARKALFANKAPMNDMHFMLNGDVEAQLLGLTPFATSSGGAAGIETLMAGSIGTRYGIEFFANQNTPSHTSGTITDTAGALNANVAKGDTSFTCKALTATDSFKAGDIIKITGDTQQYVLTSDIAVEAAATTAVFNVYPAIAKASLADAVVTIVPVNGSGATKDQNLLFHRHAMALAMAPLSTIGANLGARIATVSDPVTNLSLRSRMWYDGEHSTVKVSLDALWGVKILNPNLGVRAAL